MAEYDFELEKVLEEIKNSGAKTVGLQFPEGLKTKALGIAREIEKKTGCTTIIFADPCYGACDTKEHEAEKLGVDLIIQFGHDQF
jgi:2-(3-amino-3-carboxypropyl)histidine synthase